MKREHRRAPLMAGVSVLIAMSGLMMGVAPAAFAQTAQQATNLAEFSNLVNVMDQVDNTLAAQGTQANVYAFANAISGTSPAVTAEWESILYGGAPYTGTEPQSQGVQFFQNLLNLMVGNFGGGSANLTPTQMEQQIDSFLTTFAPGITGTDLYYFYESFRTNFITDVLLNSGAGLNGSNGLNMQVEAALEQALQAPQNASFRGILGTYGLSVSDIPAIRARFMSRFATTGIGSQQFLDDLMSTTVQPSLNANLGNSFTMTSGQTLSLNLITQNIGVGASLNGLSLPASWVSFTSSNPAIVQVVSTANGGYALDAVGVGGPVTITPILRGQYSLAPITVNVNAIPIYTGGSSTGSGTGTTGSGTTSTGTGTTSTTGTNSNGTTNYESTVNSSAFTLVLASQAIPAGGGTVNVTAGNSAVSVTVPQGALPAGDSVAVSSAPVATLQAGMPTGQTALAAFGVNFYGVTPSVPITLQIKNPSLPTSTLVYKVMADGTWMPIPATVVNGVLTLSISSDPDFVLANPNLMVDQRQILWFGQQEQVAYGVVAKDPVHGNLTTYMPIWYAMQVLKQQGITSTWNGKVWNLTTTGSAFTPNLTSLNTGEGTDQIEINGTLVQNAYGLVKVDPKHGNLTTFMPIYWVFEALNHLGLQSSWNGTTWDITQAPATSSTSTTSN